MLTELYSAIGTIRELNQDSCAISAEACLVVLADGSGPDGSVISELVVQQILKTVKENAHVFSGDEAAYRLCRYASEAIQNAQKQSAGSIAGIAALWIHRGQLSACYWGTCMIAANKKLAFARYAEFKELLWLSVPVEAYLKFALISEGIKRALGDKYIKELFQSLLFKYDKNRLDTFWTETGKYYNGDDRTLILTQTEPSDLTLGINREIVLSTDIDREFSFPLWALPAGAALVALLFSKTLRQIKSLHGLFRYIK